MITGPVTLGSISRPLWGTKALAPLTALSMVLVMVVGGRRVLESGYLGALFSSLVPLVVVVGVVLFLGHRSATLRGVTQSLVTSSAKGTARGLVHGATAVGRGTARLGRSGSVTEQVLTVSRFRVQGPLGTAESCVMVGELVGDALRSGDVVRVHGPVRRQGHRETRRAEILQTLDGPTLTEVTSKIPLMIRVARAWDAVAWLLVAVVLGADAVVLRMWWR